MLVRGAVALLLPECTAPAARLNQTQIQNVVSFNFLRTTWKLGVPGLSPCDSASVEHNGKRSPIVVMLLGSVDVSGHDIYVMTKCLIFSCFQSCRLQRSFQAHNVYVFIIP